MATEKLYAQRDLEALGEFYMQHLAAMTDEALHSKGDIAAELAWRDLQIATRLDPLSEVARWAQAVLTAWNGGDLQRESPLHKKLREVMIDFRNRTGAPGASVWLIERVNHSPKMWWTAGVVAGQNIPPWTTDAIMASRFSTKEEAEGKAERLFPAGTYAIKEYIYLGDVLMEE